MTAALLAGRLLAGAPLTRDGARDAARHELTRQPYADARPNAVLRLVGRAVRGLAHLLERAGGTLVEGAVAKVLVVLLLLVVVAVALVRLGPLGGRRPTGAVFGGDPARSAGQHRAEAEALAAAGRFAEAVRERLRAVVRELEARGVLEPRPGRTAGEVARDAGTAAPALAAGLRRGAGVFDEVWYGGRPAGPGSYAVLVELDDRVRGARTPSTTTAP